LEGRSIAGGQHFVDKYQYGGTVVVAVTIDANGTVTGASIQLGSAFDDINRIAVKRAREIKFSKGTGSQTGTIKIRFEAPKG
jgi:TonB family protein